jgi:FKBP-type peptidyl-prolyl cis-trans isomerase
MMSRYIVILSLLVVITACDIKGVETNNNTDQTDDSLTVKNQTSQIEKAETETSNSIKADEKQDSLALDNGIKITWYKHGDGEKLTKGDVIKIDYRNKLEDGTVYDGNHLVKKPYLPFVVGWNQQTPGWDIAMDYLRIGDDVDIFIPAKLARGEKGIKGVVPPNANNLLSLRILGKMNPLTEVQGVKIFKVDERKNPGDSVEMKDEVYMDYWASTESTPRFDHSYGKRVPYHFVMGDGTLVPGLQKALLYAREGDKLLISIPSELGYGEAGLKTVVKPGEDLLYDVMIGRVIKP